MSIQAVAATVATEIAAFRSAAVTSENKATPLARSILAALASGSSTPSLIESMVIHAFGNPKSPAGKPIKKLSGSGDHIIGWGATRKTVATVFGIFDNIDADAPQAATDDSDAVPGAAAIRPLIVSFILGDKDAPKSLRALNDAVKAAVAAHAATIMPDNSGAVEENKADDKPAAAPEPAAPLSLIDRINQLTVAINANPEALADAATDAAIDALVQMINDSYALVGRGVDSPVEEVPLAAAA